MSVRKRFDKELYERNDKIAKEAVLNLLDSTELHVIENTKKTQVDLLAYNSEDHVFNIECEIKRVWKDKNFQYDSVQFPERKAKYANLDKPTLFVMFNNDLTSYLVVKSEDLISSPCVEVPNKYMYKGEKFFQVPLDKVYFNDIITPIKEITND